MRILAISLLLPLVVVSAYAQSDDDFFSVSWEVLASPKAVQAEAAELAAEKNSLDRDVVPVEFPSTLTGDLFLRIGDVSFTLYVREAGGLAEAKLQSRQLSISADARKQAEAFLKELAERARVNGW